MPSSAARQRFHQSCDVLARHEAPQCRVDLGLSAGAFFLLCPRLELIGRLAGTLRRQVSKTKVAPLLTSSAAPSVTEAVTSAPEAISRMIAAQSSVSMGLTLVESLANTLRTGPSVNVPQDRVREWDD